MRIVGFRTGKRENISFGINCSLPEDDVSAWTVTYKSSRAGFIGYLSAAPSTFWRTFSQGEGSTKFCGLWHGMETMSVEFFAAL